MARTDVGGRGALRKPRGIGGGGTPLVGAAPQRGRAGGTIGGLASSNDIPPLPNRGGGSRGGTGNPPPTGRVKKALGRAAKVRG